MAITALRKPPQSAFDTIAEAWNDLRHVTTDDEMLGGAAISLSQPLPVYGLGLDAIEDEKSVNSATLSGWRYLIVQASGHALAYADLKATDNPQNLFTSLSQNRNADRLMKAARLAEDIADKLAGDCEARILEVPALNTAAFWLHGANPVFIPYIDPEHIKKSDSSIGVDPEFLPKLVARARKVRNSFTTPEARSRPLPFLPSR
jgi:hypothetical protein